MFQKSRPSLRPRTFSVHPCEQMQLLLDKDCLFVRPWVWDAQARITGSCSRNLDRLCAHELSPSILVSRCNCFSIRIACSCVRGCGTLRRALQGHVQKSRPSLRPRTFSVHPCEQMQLLLDKDCLFVRPWVWDAQARITGSCSRNLDRLCAHELSPSILVSRCNCFSIRIACSCVRGCGTLRRALQGHVPEISTVSAPTNFLRPSL